MQLIIPCIAIPIRSIYQHTVFPLHVAVVNNSRYIQRGGTVQVICRIVVKIRDEGVDIKVSDIRAGPSFGQLSFERGAVSEDAVDCRHVLCYAVGDLCDV